MLKRGLYGHPLGVPAECRVLYEGVEYYAAAMETSFDGDGNPKRTAILHEIERRTLFHVPLDQVEAVTGMGE